MIEQLSNLARLSAAGGVHTFDVVTGTEDADTLLGTEGADIISGLGGNDFISSGHGADSIDGGDGSDTIYDTDSTAGNADILRFLENVEIDQLWFRRVSNNLEVSIIGTGDKATISNWYLGSQYQIEQIQTSDGHALLNNQVDNLVQAMASFAPPAVGQTTLPPEDANV